MDESRMTVVGIGKGEVIKEPRVIKDSAVQRLSLTPVTTRETDPLARIRMLHQIKRKVYLRSIERFDKSTLKHVGTRNRSALLSDIRNFDKSTLKSVKTRHLDPVAALRKFNLEIQQFRHLDHLPMSHSMFNREMFAKKVFMKGVIPCTSARRMITLDEWKSASSIRGIRTKLTKTIDDGLKGYGKAVLSTQKTYNVHKKQTKADNHNIIFLEKGRECILERITALGVLKEILNHWLDVKKEQVTSKRRPAILQLFQCVLQEEEALSSLMDVLEHYYGRAGEIGLLK